MAQAQDHASLTEKLLPTRHDAVAPDGSLVRLLPSLAGGGICIQAPFFATRKHGLTPCVPCHPHQFTYPRRPCLAPHQPYSMTARNMRRGGREAVCGIAVDKLLTGSSRPLSSSKCVSVGLSSAQGNDIGNDKAFGDWPDVLADR
jgi:hypothetical protein